MTASSRLRDLVDAALEEGYILWELSGLPCLPTAERYIAADTLASCYNGPHAADLAAACQCFYCFRHLHSMAAEYPAWATLLGDYFFSRFSECLLPLDSVPLTDAFSAYLKSDAQSPGVDIAYLSFMRSLPAVLS